jgi:hypothetical protein
VSCRLAETHYNLNQTSGLRLRGFQSFNVNLMRKLLFILAAVITNASKTGRTGVLGTAYFVNKSRLILYWSNEYNYLVEIFEFRPVGDL